MSYNPNIRTIYNITYEPTGFPNRTDSTISFIDATRTLSISPVLASFEYFHYGIKYIKTTTETVTISDIEGSHFIYYDGYTLNTTSTFSSDLILRKALVAHIYWDSVNNKAIHFADERHGMAMPGQTHYYLHTSVGAAYLSGFTLSDFQIDGTGNASGDGYFSSSDGYFFDEDILHIITNNAPQNIYPIAQLPVYYRTGADGYWRNKNADAFPIIYSGTAGYTGANGRLPYNQWTGSVWQLTQVGNGNFVLLHILATNDITHPIVAIQGLNEYSTVNAARTAASTEISQLYGLPFIEIVKVGTIIFQTSNTYTNTIKGRIRSTGTSANYVDLRKITSLPTNQATDHGTLSGLTDPDHPAGAIYTNTTNFNGILSTADITVQTALDTLDNLTISPLTTKGDIYIRTATSDERLPVGADGYVLTADSADGYGVRWGAGGSGGANTSLSNLVTTSVNASLLPSTDAVYSLGSISNRWKDGYFSTNSLHIHSTASETGTSRNWGIGISADGYLSIKEGGTEYLSVNTSGSFKVKAGSASNIAYAFSNDSNTGMYGDAADGLYFATGGSKRLDIDSSGDVTIGATSTSALSLPLEVRRDQNDSTYLFVTNTTSGSLSQAGITVGYETGQLYGGNQTSLQHTSSGYSSDGLRTSRTGILMSDDTGGLVISARNNDIILARGLINQTSSERFRVGNTEVVVNDASQAVSFRVESDIYTHALYVKSSDGYIGIGTASPATSLDINGALRFTGSTVNLIADDTIISTANKTYIRIDSDTGSPTARTIILEQSTVAGHIIILQYVDNTGDCELIDGSSCSPAGNVRLTANWVPGGQRATLTLISDGTDWLEVARAMSL